MGIAHFPVRQGISGKEFGATASNIEIPILYQDIRSFSGRLQDALAGKL
jgi:hypothetical protein